MCECGPIPVDLDTHASARETTNLFNISLGLVMCKSSAELPSLFVMQPAGWNTDKAGLTIHESEYYRTRFAYLGIVNW